MTEHTLAVYHERPDDDTGYEEDEYEVTFDFEASYTPAKLHGPPEDCYPADFDSDFNITKVEKNGEVVEFKTLPDDVRAKINAEVDEWIGDEGLKAQEEDNFDPPDDYDDYDDLPDYYVPANYDPYGGP